MTEQVETERRTDSINLSSVAAAKVKSLLEQEGRDDLQLRISVQPGGCSGLRYQLFFDERTLDGDVVTDFDGVAVVVDRMSVPYLNGAMIDFVDSIEKQGFTIDNPNATGSCACGDSFHVRRRGRVPSVQVQRERVGDALGGLADLDVALVDLAGVVGEEDGGRGARGAAGGPGQVTLQRGAGRGAVVVHLGHGAEVVVGGHVLDAIGYWGVLPAVPIGSVLPRV